MIVEGNGTIYMGLKVIEFGAHAMVYVRTKNTTIRSSTTEIALKASNETGGSHFMCLYTGNRMHSYI